MSSITKSKCKYSKDESPVIEMQSLYFNKSIFLGINHWILIIGNKMIFLDPFAPLYHD